MCAYNLYCVRKGFKDSVSINAWLAKIIHLTFDPRQVDGSCLVDTNATTNDSQGSIFTMARTGYYLKKISSSVVWFGWSGQPKYYSHALHEPWYTVAVKKKFA